MTTEKKKRKSVPRPGAGRRGKDGAVGLVMISRLFTETQAAKIRKNGSSWLREAVQNYPDPDDRGNDG